jgi:hypothetical protein
MTERTSAYTQPLPVRDRLVARSHSAFPGHPIVKELLTQSKLSVHGELATADSTQTCRSHSEGIFT